MTDETSEPFQSWAIVELMGHQRIAGLLTEQTLGGGTFLRVDVPAGSSQPGFSKLYGASAVYCITPVAEDLARSAAESMRPRAVQEWEPPRLPEPEDDMESDDDE